MRMSYQVIARKWRPQTFEEVTGQEHITQTLRNALEYDRLHHAYLFSGARGVGKTTSARLLAKALNCHKTTDKPNLTPCRTTDADACASCVEISESRSMDVLEIDAASHTGIDDVRDTIIENINVNPARDRYRVFIIDEVHQLSKPAFNALLKTLEEPPAKVVFIMATTEHHKVPETIASRCQEFEFRTIPIAKIFDRLRLIADAEKVNVDDDALREIARSGEGSMRDAQSNFDQVISFSGEHITVADVTSALGMASVDMLTRAVSAVAEKQSLAMLEIVADLVSRGQDLRNFCRDLMAVIRDISVYKIGEDAELVSDSPITPDVLKSLGGPFSISDLVRFYNSLADTESRLKDATQTRYTLEIGLVKLVEMRRLAPIESIIERLAALAGEPAAVPPQPTQKASAAPSASVPAEPAPSAPTRSAAPAEPEKKTLISEPPAAAQPPADPNDGWQERDLSDLEPPEEQFDLPDEVTAAAADQAAEPAKWPSIDLSFVDSVPVKLPPISSEQLEHVDDEKLDAAYESALQRAGELLKPIAGAEDIYRSLVNEKAAAVSSQGAAAVPARDVSAYSRPVREIDSDEVPLPVLSDSPTEEELIAYASAHPSVRRVMRAFRATVVGVEDR